MATVRRPGAFISKLTIKSNFQIRHPDCLLCEYMEKATKARHSTGNFGNERTFIKMTLK
jgi:hypothetical protein